MAEREQEERLKNKKRALDLEADRKPSEAQASSVAPVQDELARNILDMHRRCGRFTKEMKYNPDQGCFYFDNLEGGADKKIELWFGLHPASIRAFYAEKAEITITSLDGATCKDSAANACRSWLGQHPSHEGGYHKYTVLVPKGQALVANNYAK